MNMFQQIFLNMAARPIPSLSATSGGSIMLAAYSWFEESLPLIQWFAAFGAIICSLLSLVVIYLTIDKHLHERRNR